MVIYLPAQSVDEEPILDELTPREIVRELDKHVVGQADAGAAVVLTRPKLQSEGNLIARESTANPATSVGPRNLAYVIYTSGSTGTAKGVLVEHRSVCNLAAHIVRLFELDATSRVLQFASPSFDASVWDFFIALLSGGRLYLPGPDTLLAGQNLLELLD